MRLERGAFRGYMGEPRRPAPLARRVRRAADGAAAEAFPHIEALRKTIEAARFALRGPGRPRKKPATPRPRPAPRKEVSVTVSIGLAERDGRKSHAHQVIAAADKALYRAKGSGRNRVMV